MSLDDSLTKALLHMDGVSGGVSFIDESGKIWTPSGNANTSTSQFKFGPSSCLLDGNGDYLSTPDHTDFTIGAGNFTVDMWIRPTVNAFFGFASHSSNINAGASTSFYFGRDYAANTLRGTIGTTGGTLIHVYSTTLITVMLNTWTHIALERYGTQLNLFVNGTREGQVSASTYTISDAASTLTIGSLGGLYYYTGWIEEFRFSATARYLGANFTVPTTQYGSYGYHGIHRSDRRIVGSVDHRTGGYTI